MSFFLSLAEALLKLNVAFIEGAVSFANLPLIFAEKARSPEVL